MFVFSALVFDGKKQHFVRRELDSLERFRGYLTAEFGLHVVVWIEQQNTTLNDAAACHTTDETKETALRY